jgi:phosphate transport system substrate-binding protein
VKITRLGSIAACALVGSLTLAGCAASGGSDTSPSASPSGPDYSSLSGTITAGGSSAQGAAEDAWVAAFGSFASGVTVNYDKSQGSGGGQTNFLAGAYDFAGSDAPLSADQTTQAATSPCGANGAINLPIYLDGESIVFNLAGVSKLNLTTSTIAKIFNLKITDWSDATITKDNGGTALPAGPITTVARSDGSGTTFNFTSFLAGADAADWPYPAGKSWPVKGNVSLQQGGSGVASTVGAGTGTIGYVDHSAIGKLSAATVNGVAFSAVAVGKSLSAGGVDASNGVTGDLSLKFDYSKMTGTDVYPIPLLSYAILCNTFKDAAQAKLTKGYLSFITSATGQAVAAKNVGSAPLPADLLAKVAKSLGAVK